MKKISCQLDFDPREHKRCEHHFSSVFVGVGIILPLLCIVLSGCVDTGTDVNLADTFTIACTIPPQEEFIRAVAGNTDVTVHVMVPPGSSPHTFEPAPSQIKELESADLYIALGSGIEFENRWLDRIAGMYPDLPIINTSYTVLPLTGTEYHHTPVIVPVTDDDIGDNHEVGKDPHVWLSLNNAGIMVREIGMAMSAKRPELLDTYRKNQDIYLEQLNRTDTNIRRSLEILPSRTVLVYHPAFGYFCQEYNLTQIAVERDGHEPSAKALASLIDEARSNNISLVFAEPESSTREARTLAGEINGTMLLISPLAGNYLENMQDIADKIGGNHG